MANQKNLFANPNFAKLKLAGLTAALMLSSADLSALGLGAFEVQSNLDQPLRGVIELRTSSGDDVDSVRASIASRADFENLGIDYPSYLSDISLTLEQDGADLVLQVNSADVIIKEPFIHFLVRVDWSGGSFLREYTALIDPPVYAAESPQSLSEPKLVGTDQSYQADTVESYDLDPVDESTVVEEELIDSEPNFIEEASVEDTPDSADNDEYYEPEAVSDVVAENVDDQSNQEELPTQATDAQYGPVESGESLSLIAQELQRQFPDLSIYQIMQVMFEENQSSFISGNINGLIKGSVLNIGDLNAIRAVDVEQSKVFFRNQLSEWDPSVLLAGNDDSLRVSDDEYSFDSDSYTSDSDFSSTDSQATDNFQVGSSSDTESFASAGSGDNGGEVIALRQQITELQTSLASGSIENQELTERISILEGQLADMNRLMNLSIEDADLANVEATLAAQNNASADGSDLVVADAVEAVESGETVVDADFVDSLLAESESLNGQQSLASIDTPVDGGLELLEPDLEDEGALEIQEIKEVEVAESWGRKPQDTSFLGKVKKALFDDGLWKILAGVGALLIAGLGLFLFRRRRADEEFEISMLSIESNSQSVDADAAIASAPMSASHSHSELTKDGGDKETSFLTVYSDSDAVVQADEVDPIAEADVYIAYGRDEQAEEVLLDGITSNPVRLDIKHKLLGLYHKNQNIEGYERVAEELYSQRGAVTPEIWADVCKMGKELSTDNPLFDLSSDDLAAAELVDESGSGSQAETVVDEVVSNAVESDDATDLTASIESVSEIDSIGAESFELEADEIEEMASEAIGDSLDDNSENSIQLINFDDGRSEISELDEVEIDALALDDEIERVSMQADSIEIETHSDSIEIDLSDELGSNSIEFESTPALIDEISLRSDDEEHSFDEVQEVSDLEIDPDYDESRTQYELAKVFVDLGDEDGARKILKDIVDNTKNSKDVLDDAKALLESIS